MLHPPDAAVTYLDAPKMPLPMSQPPQQHEPTTESWSVPLQQHCLPSQAQQLLTPSGALSSEPLPASPRTQDHVVTLVSGLVINQKAFVNNCGLPLGAVLDFRPAESLGLRGVHGRLAPRCRSCASFLHVYCKTNAQKGLWRCTFCEVVNTAPDIAFNDVQSHPELCDEGVDFVYDAPSPPRLPPPQHLVLAIDATMDAPVIEGLTTALLSALANQDPTTSVSVVSFDSAVSLHAMGPEQRCSYALPGGRLMDPELVQFYLHHGGVPLSAPLGDCLPYLGAVLGSIHALDTTRPQFYRSRCSGVAVEASLVLLSSLLSQAAGGLPAPGSAGLGPLGRVLMFVGGPITRGAGYVPVEALDGQPPDKAAKKSIDEALKYATNLGRSAQAVGSAVDIFVGASGAANAPLLLSLARSSGGEVIAHQGFGPLFGSALATALGRRLGDHATLDCYASEGLQLMQWMGPVDVLKLPSDSRVLHDRRVSDNACSVTAFEMGRGVGMRFEMTRDLSEAAVYVQVVLRYNEPRSGRLITRVVTRRMPVVGTLADYLRSINPLAASVLLGKKLALDAQKLHAPRDPRRAEEMRYAVGALLNLVGTRCGRQVQASRGVLGFGGKRLRLWPPELLPLAQALYQLQRGPLLGAQAPAHADDRSLLTERIICGAGGPTFRTLAPQLYKLVDSSSTDPRASTQRPTWSFGGMAPELLPVPAVNIIVDMSSTYLLDCGTTMVIVLPAASAAAPAAPPPKQSTTSQNGSAQHREPLPSAGPSPAHPEGSAAPPSTEPQPQDAATAAATRSKPATGTASDLLVLALAAATRAVAGRFPGSDVCVTAHDSADAYSLFYSRLVAAHRDTPQEQRVQSSQVPGLEQLSDAQIMDLAQRFWSTPDTVSFIQWCRDVGVQAYSMEN